MIFTEAEIPGAFLIETQPVFDDRGFFVRTWCVAEFESRGLDARWVQISSSLSSRRGTLRGIHYQIAPRAEVKLIRCVRGAVFDVIVDLRQKSSSYGKWMAVELTPHNRLMLYVPSGVAHGFMTLENDTELNYQISERYSPDHARGVRWNDPALAISWPGPVTAISEKDANYPDLAL